EKKGRSDRAARTDRVAQWQLEVDLVAHVADRGDAGGEVHGRPLHLHYVRVHVPEAGDDRPAANVNAPRAVRHANAVTRPRGEDASVGNDDCGVTHRLASRTVDQ